MARSLTSWAAVAALALLTEAQHHPRPQETGTFVYPSDGVSPKPTAGPRFHPLVRRASSTSSVETVLVAPDNVCGYIDALTGAAYTCPDGALCAFYTAEATMTGSVACCDQANCYVRRDCIDYDGYFSSSQCTGGCKFDAYTLKCTDAFSAYCNTISFPGDIIDYWCNSEANTDLVAANTTYSGQKDHTFTPLPLTASDLSTVTSATGNNGPGASGAPTTSASAESSPSASSGGSGGGDSSSSDKGDSGKDDKGGSSTPVGPIVGGVVGGVAGLALVGAGIWFLLRHNKKKQQGKETFQSSPAQQYSAPPAGYDPNAQAYYGAQQPYMTPQQQPQQQYFNPQQQQLAPGAAGSFYPGGPSPATSPDPNVTSSTPGSHMTDPRMSYATGSPGSQGGYGAPTPGSFQPNQDTIHEAPTLPTETHRGDTHELA